jgi:hypothetical protein
MKSYSNFLSEAVEGAQNAWAQWLKNNPKATAPGGKFYNDEEKNKAAREFMKTFQRTGKAPDWATTSGGSSTPPPPPKPPEPPKSPEPETPKRPPSQQPPKTPPTRATNIARGVGRFGAATALDVGTEYAIGKIKDPTQQTLARTAKDLALTYAAPVASVAGLQGSTPQRQEYQADKTTQVSLPANYGTKSYERNPNDPRNAIYVQKTKPSTPEDQMFDPKNPLDVRKWKFQAGSPKPVGKPERYGLATQGGQRVMVPYGSVAGQKKVGGKNLPQVVQARQQASKANVYGATKGSGIVGIGGKTTFNTKANTITTGGKTAALPRTKILPGGAVGDLAYRGGKPVYVARGSMVQRGNQSLLARVSRATGIGGQRERDTAALNRERQQAMQSTLRYRKQLGITGTGVSKPPKK